MKSSLNQDIIEKIGSDLGPIPKGVGIERLRWDGQKIVDLADLLGIWVEEKGGGYALHCRQVPNSQLVVMTYRDRKNLITEGGVIRVKTADEIQTEQTAEHNMMLKNRLRSALKREAGDTQDQLADTCKLLYSLIELVLTGDEGIRTTLTQVLPDLQGIYTQEQVTATSTALQKIKSEVTEYYAVKNETTKEAER